MLGQNPKSQTFLQRDLHHIITKLPLVSGTITASKSHLASLYTGRQQHSADCKIYEKNSHKEGYRNYMN